MENDSQKFVTKNVYKGDWDEKRKCMEGFGVYAFQDGSEYHGYFQNGTIHGCGLWQFDLPYNCSVVTTFNKGKLENLHNIVYADGLHFDNQKNDTLDFKNWKYCTETDRRYAEEIFRGLQAVGAEPFAERFNLVLKPNEYDTMDAVFLKKSGFKISRNSQVTNANFVACDKEREWIKNNCPKGLEPGEHRLPNKIVAKKILKANLQAKNEMKEENNLIKGLDACSADKRGSRYFERLCEFESEDAEVISVTSNINTINKGSKSISDPLSRSVSRSTINLQSLSSSSSTSCISITESLKHKINE